ATANTTCGPGRRNGLCRGRTKEQDQKGGQDALRSCSLNPNRHLSTKPGQAQTSLKLADWLMVVARQCGEPALDCALGPGWPGTRQQREWIMPHIEGARNEARQLASEMWAKEWR